MIKWETVEGGKLPERKLRGAGRDVFSRVDASIPVGRVGIIPAGFRIQLPEDLELQIRARSGLASKGILVANGPGTVDWNFRGEVGVILINLSGAVFEIRAGDRIAQAVIAKVVIEDPVQGPVDMNTDRGEKGFGSTGI